MIKFKKDFNVKIIALFITVSFFLNSTVYGIDLPVKTNLRLPLTMSNKEGKERFQRAGEMTTSLGNSKKYLKFLGLYRIRPKQVEMAVKIMNTYNSTFELKKSKAEINKLANKIYAFDIRWSPLTVLYLAVSIWNFCIGTINIYQHGNFYTILLNLAMASYLFWLWWTRFFEDFNPHISLITNNLSLPMHYLTVSASTPYVIAVIAHELAHAFRLPNNMLLAEAYSLAVFYKLKPEAFEYLTEDLKGIDREDLEEFDFYSRRLWDARLIGDIALKTIADPFEREAVIRKMLFNYSFDTSLEDDETNRKSIERILKNIHSNLEENDYRMPKLRNDTFGNDGFFPYLYAAIIGYIAIRSYSDADKALQYIYKLGQALDSRELKGFEPQGMPTGHEHIPTTTVPLSATREHITVPAEESWPPVYLRNIIDPFTRQPDKAI